MPGFGWVGAAWWCAGVCVWVGCRGIVGFFGFLDFVYLGWFWFGFWRTAMLDFGVCLMSVFSCGVGII